VSVSAFIFLECAAGRAKDVARQVSKITGVKLSHAVTGPHDVIAYVEASDINALGTTIVSKVQAVPGVLRTTTNVVVK
jgi:DNA-binding Lrp family transcriptional regulator